MTMDPVLGGYVVRTTSTGDPVWTKRYFAMGQVGTITWTDIEIAGDGNYYVSGWGGKYNGTVSYGVWLAKLQTNGDTIWTRFFSTDPDGSVFVTHDMKVTPDGGMVITGQFKADIPSWDDAFMLKYAADGSFEWYQQFTTDAVEDIAFSIENAWDGGYIMCSVYDTIGINQLKLTKTNEAGQYQWSVLYSIDLPSNIDDYPCIIRTTDNKYVIAAESDADYGLMKIDQQGAIEWFHTYGFPVYEQQPYFVQQTRDGGFIITGQSFVLELNTDVIWVVKTDGTGETIEWQKQIDYQTYPIGNAIRQTQDDGYIIFGSARAHPDSLDYLMMIKLGGSNDIGEQPGFPGKISLQQNNPNPFRNKTTISYSLQVPATVTLKIISAEGIEAETLVSRKQAAGNYAFTFDGSRLSPGMYYYQLKTEKECITKKMILIR
jgi:hypothetical protein